MSRLYREREIMNLLMKGMYPVEIAKDMGLSHLTVQNYMSLIARRTGLGKRSRFHPWARMIYLEAKARGLLPGWPD